MGKGTVRDLESSRTVPFPVSVQSHGPLAVLFMMRAGILVDEGLQILAFVVETITYRRMLYIGTP